MQRTRKRRNTNSWKHLRRDRHQYEFKGEALSKWTGYDEYGYIDHEVWWEPVHRNKRNTPFMLEENFCFEDT